MNRTMCALAAAALTAAANASVSYTGTYAENFDSMGTGTAAPMGWKHFVTSFGSNTTWSSSIPASGANSVASMAVGTAGTVLSAVTNPSANANNGYNAAVFGDVSNRALATAPTTVAGAMIQLDLDNSTGADIAAGSQLTVSFDTIRYTSVTSQNQLPGFWLFVSLDGVTWQNIGANPTAVEVPNTVGVTSSSFTFSLAGAWTSGSTLYFRWVDDNAQQTSPDQIIGLDNVSIVPGPGSLALLGAAALSSAFRRRRA